MRWRITTTYRPTVIDGRLVLVRENVADVERVTPPEDRKLRTPPSGDPLVPRRLLPMTVADIERAARDQKGGLLALLTLHGTQPATVPTEEELMRALHHYPDA